MGAAVAIAVAGAIGSLARYGLDRLVEQHTESVFPWSTFAINVSGCFLIGLAVPLLVDRFHEPTWLTLAVTFGLLGGYTTFSTLGYETFELVELRHYGLAAVNLLASGVAGTAAVAAGHWLAR